MTVGELVKKVGNLKNYYINSVGGGGVTVSGGEPLTQFQFLTCFLYAVKKVNNLKNLKYKKFYILIKILKKKNIEFILEYYISI